MDKLKYIKLEQEDGSYSESIPLSVDADYVDVSGDSLTSVLGKKADAQEINNLQNQINIEKARIDNITNLPEGSTSGDAELIDMRVDIKGNIHQNAGDSLRSQINGLNNKINNNISLSNNLLNIETSKNNIGLVSATGEETDNSNYWVTDFIGIDENAEGIFTNYIKIHKICFYNENKEFISVKAINNTKYTETDIPQSTKYYRLQFSKEFISYENIIQVFITNNPIIVKNFLPYEVINSKNIIDYSINNMKLDKNTFNLINYTLLKQNIFPLRIEDFMVGGVGIYQYPTLINNQRLITIPSLLIPKYTTLKFGSNLASILQYDKNDNFIKNLALDVSEFTFLEDCFVRLSIKTENNDAITDGIAQQIYSSIIVKYNQKNHLTYYGDKIIINNKLNYKIIENAYCEGQDSACHNNKLFNFDSTGKFKVFDLINNEYIGQGQLDEYDTIKPHNNCVCFGNEFVNENDNYPLLYTNAYNTANLPKGMCYVHRIIENENSYSTELKQTIRINFTDNIIWTDGNDIRPYGNFLVDKDNNYLYVYTLKDNEKVTRIFKFILPKLEDGENVTLNIEDVIDYFDVEYFPYIQGAICYSGKLFISSGNNSIIQNSSALHVVNPYSKQEESYINLSSLFNEPEVVEVYNNKLIVGMSNLYEFEF